VIGTLAVDGWAVTFGTAKRGLDSKGLKGGLSPRLFYFAYSDTSNTLNIIRRILFGRLLYSAKPAREGCSSREGASDGQGPQRHGGDGTASWRHHGPRRSKDDDTALLCRDPASNYTSQKTANGFDRDVRHKRKDVNEWY